MKDVLAIATIIAGLAGVFTIIQPFIKIYLDHNRYKEYLNQKSKTFHKRIIKYTKNKSQNDSQYKRASTHVCDIISEFDDFLHYELEQKENIGKRKSIRKEIDKQRVLLGELINRYNNAKEDNTEIQYQTIAKEIKVYFLKF